MGSDCKLAINQMLTNKQNNGICFIDAFYSYLH
nr:MAG TPA: hypothetical protein [Bacteriophage sp.]